MLSNSNQPVPIGIGGTHHNINHNSNSNSSNNNNNLARREDESFTRPLKRVMGQMYAFYLSLLESVRSITTSTISIKSSSPRGTPISPSANAVVAGGILATAWRNLYGDSDSHQNGNGEHQHAKMDGEAHTALLKQASDLLLKHRQTFPALSQDHGSWRWGDLMLADGCTEFDKLAQDPVRLERQGCMQDVVVVAQPFIAGSRNSGFVLLCSLLNVCVCMCRALMH